MLPGTHRPSAAARQHFGVGVRLEDLPVAALSAGILMFRRDRDEARILLVHPGGPYWAKKDLGAWSIPKGEYASGDDPRAAALREFEEELGMRPEGALLPLGEIVQKGGKRVTAFALEGECEIGAIASNTFEIEWPPHSGRRQSFPEVDRAEWFTLDEARGKLLHSQLALLDLLAKHLAATPRR
jgi:predicted NUDIX family NTP pyrophosphohydrolase